MCPLHFVLASKQKDVIIADPCRTIWKHKKCALQGKFGKGTSPGDGHRKLWKIPKRSQVVISSLRFYEAFAFMGYLLSWAGFLPSLPSLAVPVRGSLVASCFPIYRFSCCPPWSLTYTTPGPGFISCLGMASFFSPLSVYFCFFVVPDRGLSFCCGCKFFAVFNPQLDGSANVALCRENRLSSSQNCATPCIPHMPRSQEHHSSSRLLGTRSTWFRQAWSRTSALGRKKSFSPACVRPTLMWRRPAALLPQLREPGHYLKPIVPDACWRNS